MRCTTAHQVKAGKRGLGSPTNATPRDGTRLRAVYDLFQANKGIPVEFQFSRFGGDSSLIIKLTDFYGLDIRRIRNGSTRVGRVSTWILAGEWFGKVYVDYIAERLHEVKPSEPERAQAS